MDNPGIVNLGNLAIVAAGIVVGDIVPNLEGMVAASFQTRFVFGAGGGQCRLYLQTSLDQGQTWIDIACILCTTANKTAVHNLSGLTPKTAPVVPTDGALADDTAIDGILGDRLRLKAVVTAPAYSGQTLASVFASVR